MSTRTIDTRTVPATGTWVIDPSHSTISAVARHLVVSKVRGTFGDFAGTIIVTEDPAESVVEFTIQSASITTNAEDRDTHLRSPDFLDTENYPQLTFVGTSVTPQDGHWNLAGDLTMRGVTHPIEIDFDFLGVFADPWGNQKAAFTGSATLVREQWGVNWNAPLEAGGLLVSKKLEIELEIQAALQS
ncbi:MAG: YceI family protein [Acidimicrobiia bacterium]|nr:YceI family protein [Acidimicrobiia bacterium]